MDEVASNISRKLLTSSIPCKIYPSLKVLENSCTWLCFVFAFAFLKGLFSITQNINFWNDEPRSQIWLLIFYVLFTLGVEINWTLHFVRCLEEAKGRQKEVRRVGRHSRRKIRDSNNMPERKAKKDDETRPREGWQKSWLFKKGYYKTEINCNLLTYYFKRCEKKCS